MCDKLLGICGSRVQETEGSPSGCQSPLYSLRKSRSVYKPLDRSPGECRPEVFTPHVLTGRPHAADVAERLVVLSKLRRHKRHLASATLMY